MARGGASRSAELRRKSPHSRNGDRNRILGNEVSGTQRVVEGLFQGNGLTVTDPSSENVVRANRIVGNARHGIEVRGDDNLFAANRAMDNGQHGITAGTSHQQRERHGQQLPGDTAFGDGGFHLGDFAPGQCTLNAWPANHGVKLHDGSENG